MQLGTTLQHPMSAACGALSPLQGQGAAGCLCDMPFSMARPAINCLFATNTDWGRSSSSLHSLISCVLCISGCMTPVSCEKWGLSRELSTDFQGTVFPFFFFF